MQTKAISDSITVNNDNNKITFYLMFQCFIRTTAYTKYYEYPNPKLCKRKQSDETAS